MARNPLAIYLVLLVALCTVYETQGTFSLPHYLENFPKVGKDFGPFAYKGMSDFMSDLEGMCPGTPEFKNFFATLNDYMGSFSSKDIQGELSVKSENLFKAMSALDGTQTGLTEDSWKLMDGLLSVGKGLVEMKKSDSKEITFDQRKDLINSMVKWTRGIGLFVKKASESKGKSIDLSTFGIDHEKNVKRALFETQGAFSLPHYLKDFPKTGKDFESYAYKGMLDFSASLESKCPATPEFKDFFAKLEDFMGCFKLAQPGSEEMIKFAMAAKSDKLFKTMSVLDGGKTGTTEDSWRMIDGMLTMAKVLFEMKKNGLKEITFEQRKEAIGSMVKWARSIGLFVKIASEKNGKSIDLSSFGIEYTHGSTPVKGASGEL